MYIVVAVVVLGAFLILMAALLVPYNLKRRHIIGCARSASDAQLEAIYSWLDRNVPQPPACVVLARINRRANDDRWLIPIPSLVTPWGGRVISANIDGDVSFTLVESNVVEPQLRGKIFRLVPMPPTTDEDWQDVGTPLVRFTKEHPQLQSALEGICPKHPAELLQYLLGAGAETFELDPMNQVQLGGSPAWVQDEEFPLCRECQRPMKLILQVPGTMLRKAMPRGTFFFFGCVEHPEQTRTVGQFT